MLFSRRALQRRLHELRPVLGTAAADALVARLNRPGRDRLAAMWEAVVMHGLSRQGTIHSEEALASGRRPDIRFEGAASFVVDVTSVSDDGLDERNPYQEFSTALERLKTRLGLPVGGMDLRIGARRERVRGGERTSLLLPSRGRITDFVRDKVEPELRKQLAERRAVLSLKIVEEDYNVDITIDPRRCPYNSGSYAGYDTPTVRDRNPLYNALKQKAQQIRGAESLRGVIVGDADTKALGGAAQSRNAVSTRDILEEFLRQHGSVAFVFAISVEEEQVMFPQIHLPKRLLRSTYAVSRTINVPAEVESTLAAMLRELPRPIRMPVNAALRARESGYGWGHHGGHQMSRRSIKIGARELLEVLAGRRSVQEMNEAHRWFAAEGAREPGRIINPFELQLRQGRLPTSVVIDSGEDESDDWIEIEFGEPDAAISPFR